MNPNEYGRQDGNSNREEGKISSLLGIGLDAEDGQVRLTRGPNFALFGGSQQTHEVMTETVCKVNENLGRRGKVLQETTPTEFQDVLQEVVESMNLRNE